MTEVGLVPSVAVDVPVQAAGLIRLVLQPVIAQRRPVGGRLALVSVHLALGKGQIESGGEGQHVAQRLRNDALIIRVVHHAKLSVGQLEDHAGKGLSDAVGHGPDQRDGIIREIFRGVGVQLLLSVSGVFNDSPHTVLIVRNEGELLSLLDFGEDGLARPDGGALGVGVDIAVKLGADGAVFVVVDLQRAVLEVHAAVDDDGVIHAGLAVGARGLGAGGDVMLPASYHLLGEFTLEDQKDLFIGFRAFEGFKGRLITEGFDIISAR